MNNDVKAFFESCETHLQVIFPGMFDMPLNIFFSLYEYYNESGINLVDDYVRLIYLNETDYYDEKDLNQISDSISKIRALKILPNEDIDKYLFILKILKTQHRIRKEKKINEKRVIACRFTSKKQIRNRIFEFYGEVCLSCGTNENISLDHVIPVDKKGTNDISNLQPLCKSCNSKKGVDIIDFRKEVCNG